MYYRGYKIVAEPRATRVVPARPTYDIKDPMDADKMIKCNFATVECAKLYIDWMILFGRLKDRRKEA